MAEKEQPAEPDKVEETGEQSEDTDKLIARLEALEAERENQKKNESGLQRTITELKNKLEEKERESETAEERLERKLREFDEKEREYTKKQRDLEVTLAKRDVMAELGIPKKFESRIFGDTPDEIRKDAEEFARIYSEDLKTGVEKGVNERLTSGPDSPKKGEQPKTVRLETRQDAEKASEEDFVQYLNETLKE